VDNALDRVAELTGQGNDRVFASVSYVLGGGTSVETLSTDFHAGTGAINLTGNELALTIYGNAGANVITGGGGADSLVGFGGDDVYFVSTASTSIVEAAGAGNDRVFASVSYTLTAGASVELMTTTYHAGTDAINLTGNELANTIQGNDGANVLDGKGGNDTLIGLAGADTFAFTTALGAGNVDFISGFEHGVDKIALDDAIFTAIGGLGALDSNAFVTGFSAADASDRIIYDSTSGRLFYDADGLGGAAQVQIASLNGSLPLTASDFIVI
jgi:Ca2+-binding RTX toxin-like protein